MLIIVAYLDLFLNQEPYLIIYETLGLRLSFKVYLKTSNLFEKFISESDDKS